MRIAAIILASIGHGFAYAWATHPPGPLTANRVLVAGLSGAFLAAVFATAVGRGIGEQTGRLALAAAAAFVLYTLGVAVGVRAATYLGHAAAMAVGTAAAGLVLWWERR